MVLWVGLNSTDTPCSPGPGSTLKVPLGNGTAMLRPEAENMRADLADGPPGSESGSPYLCCLPRSTSWRRARSFVCSRPQSTQNQMIPRPAVTSCPRPYLHLGWPLEYAGDSKPVARSFSPLMPRDGQEGDDPLRRSCHAGDDEADTRIKLSGMPFDLRNHPARLGPASGLIAEVRMKPAHLVWRSPNRTLEQITDPVLEDLVGRQPDRILDPFGFQVFVDARHGEGCVGPEIDARYLALVACDHRLERTVPAVGAVHVART